jgi:hypothetical protein
MEKQKTVSTDYFLIYITPNWKKYGYPDWDYTRFIIIFAGLQILCIAGGYILSKAISYFAHKNPKIKEISD